MSKFPGPPPPPGHRRDSAQRSDPAGLCGLAYFYERNKADIWAREGLNQSSGVRRARELYQ